MSSLDDPPVDCPEVSPTSPTRCNQFGHRGPTSARVVVGQSVRRHALCPGPTLQHRPNQFIVSSFVGATLWLSGCGAPQRFDAVPSAVAGEISFVDIANARFDDDSGTALMDEIRRSFRREHDEHVASAAPPSFLALSGGGEDGAFGAGLLVGWLERAWRATPRATPV
jgi:hypothetical protein